MTITNDPLIQTKNIECPAQQKTLLVHVVKITNCTHFYHYTCILPYCIVIIVQQKKKNTMFDDHVLLVHVYIAPTMLTELLYPLQCGDTPLHLAARGGYTVCVEHFLSATGIDVNIINIVSWSIE